MNLNELIPVAKKFLQATLATQARNRTYKEESRDRGKLKDTAKYQSLDKSRISKDATKDIMQIIHRAIYSDTFSPKYFEHKVRNKGHVVCFMDLKITLLMNAVSLNM